MSRLRGNEGFTLVEMAIVLVIIGIILGAILKGQELITNAKIKRLYNQYREIMAAVYTYYDKYDRLPGDDDTASNRWTGAPDGDGNGRIDGGGTGATAAYLTCSGAGSSEACYIWRHLRYANIIPGDPTQSDNPKHVYGGSIGIKNDNLYDTGYRHWIVFQRVPNEIAELIDQKYDDGEPDSGSIVVETGTYDTPDRKELCFRLD